MVVGATLDAVECFTNCWAPGILTTSHPPPGFTENRPNKNKWHPVNGSYLEENALSISGVRVRVELNVVGSNSLLFKLRKVHYMTVFYLLSKSLVTFNSTVKNPFIPVTDVILPRSLPKFQSWGGWFGGGQQADRGASGLAWGGSRVEWPGLWAQMLTWWCAYAMKLQNQKNARKPTVLRHSDPQLTQWPHSPHRPNWKSCYAMTPLDIDAFTGVYKANEGLTYSFWINLNA